MAVSTGSGSGSAETMFEDVASKIENQCRLPAKNFNLLKAKASKLASESKYFSLLEVECLIRQFYVLVGQESNIAKSIKGMNKEEFMSIFPTMFGIDTKIMMDRIFATLDLKKDGYIGVEEWVEALGIFLRGELDEKSTYTFQVYDLNSDKCVSKDEMFYLLKNGEMTTSKFDLGLEDLLDIMFEVVGHDQDGLLSYPHFRTSVQNNSMYLQAFGKCLPDGPAVDVFENHLAELKKIVKARGKREMNIPKKGCLLNVSSARPSHVPTPTTTSEKRSRFLPMLPKSATSLQQSTSKVTARTTTNTKSTRE